MHTKRITAGKGKKPKWLITLNAGSHKKGSSMPLLYLIRDILHYADNNREAELIINKGLVLVNKKIAREAKNPVGLMDVVEIPLERKRYRLLPSHGGIKVKEITEAESNIKPCRIVDKQVVKNKGVQLNLHDGTTILLNKDAFKTKDTLVLEMPSRKIKDTIEFKKGNLALISQGRHAGQTGIIEEIIEGTAAKRPITKVGGIDTPTDYLFVIGKEKPLIAL
ncbi:MAG: S4 domain-containing protein [Candidatus Altiarchaeota archaeon]|nr:S4 domain-containing protein [Candidatus Altiarchaeota archaeon]